MPKADKEDSEDRKARYRAAQQDFQNGVYTTYADAARAHRVSPVTLSNRIRGIHTDARAAQEARQKLSKPAEDALVDWGIFHGMIGVPWAKEALLLRAQEIAGPDIKITVRWCRRFLHRHRRKLKYKFAYELDPKRASGFNRPTVDAYFQMLAKLMKDYDIPVAHFYNMDEKGLQIGGGRSTSRRKHLFGLLQKAQYKLKHDNLELMTIIECICADGFVMKPTFVHQPGDVGFWWDDKQIGCCVATENGWTSDDICEAWFIKVFLKTAISRRVSDAPIVLLLDGHGSHISLRILELAYQNRVFIVCLPPKTTHKLQPLDVGVFNLVQAAWKRLCEDSAAIGEPISKSTAISRYMRAREAGLHPAAVLDAWRRAGQHPLDPSIFVEEDYAPSKVSSTSVHLPPSFPALGQPFTCDSDPLAEGPDNIPVPVVGGLELDIPPDVQGSPPGEDASGDQTEETTLGNLMRKPVRGHFIGDWHGLPLKQQVAGLSSNVETMWQRTTSMWEQLQSLNAHATLLRVENEGLRQQIQARKKPKKTQDEATAASKLQKHGFLTNPETEAAFKTYKAEIEAKRVAEEQKTADKDAKAREVENKRRLMLLDPNHVFTGSLQSYKTATLEQLGDLAASLAMPFSGLKKAELFSNITERFEAHPELKSLPRYANLFRVGRAPRRVINQAADLDQLQVIDQPTALNHPPMAGQLFVLDQIPVPVAGPAFPPPAT